MTPKKNKTCERCGFVPIDMCQLDVVYIDGCCNANDPSNYMTLCASCHRLKTQLNGDHLTPSDRAALRDAWKQGDMFN